MLERGLQTMAVGTTDTDWSVFKTTDLNVYAEHITGYINRLVEECIPTKTVVSFPNSKPLMNTNIRI